MQHYAACFLHTTNGEIKMQQTKHKPLDVPGSPYWCGKKDKQDGLKSRPHYYPSMLAGSMKRWGTDRMMQMEIEEYELGYNEN